ncbi:MAG: lasso peptide biosynthesis PqqD family chaperone [Deltaproteobacteria bacterium]|jgi:hypothetical protein|nr:lasso peptide biosynthesis PqqD family chaperone [Deltaproteobacteria bacterium]MBT4640775.1 lasso peptide biosynthesis PqqD family chaperone [Deltaproteobacteria bacterium]
MKKVPLSNNSFVQQIKELVSSDVDGETILMSIENGKYYGMDKVGSHIWEHLKSPIMVSDLVDLLLIDFKTERKTCEADVLEFLNELRKENVILVENQS